METYIGSMYTMQQGYGSIKSNSISKRSTTVLIAISVILNVIGFSLYSHSYQCSEGIVYDDEM